jgi:hypothetical protein
MARPNDNTVQPSQGGRLVNAESTAGVGPANYVEKVNFRRVGDREERREGWTLFKPNAGLPQGVQAVPSADRVLLIAECVRPNLERALIAATRTAIYKYVYSSGTWLTMGTGYSSSGRRWQTAIINGYLTLNNGVDLPVSVRVEESTAVPLYELREVGVAAVGYITENNGYLLCFDVSEIIAAELNGIMNGGSPYGIVASNKINRIAYLCIWGEYAEPRRWAPAFKVTMASASATITLPFPTAAFAVGTKLAVIGGGPDGGVLGGQEAYPDGIPISSITGAAITLPVSTDAGLTYPRTVTVMRWTDLSTLAGRFSLQDDSSPIIGVKPLNGRTMIYRKTGIFRASYVGSATKPFDFKVAHRGPKMPLWHEAIADVRGEFHVYPGHGNRFYTFDGSNEPQFFEPCDDARNLLFDGVTPSTDVFVTDNVATNEVWWCRPGRTMALDIEKMTASKIDAEIHAACYIEKPGGVDSWFTMAIEGTLYQYGLVNKTVLTYLRNGVSPGGRIKGGLYHWNDRYNEKDLVAYLLHLASSVPEVDIQLKLYSSYDERVNPSLILTENFTGPTYLVTCEYRAIYFQDEIIITEAADVRIAVTARTWDRAPLKTCSTPRT